MSGRTRLELWRITPTGGVSKATLATDIGTGIARSPRSYEFRPWAIAIDNDNTALVTWIEYWTQSFPGSGDVSHEDGRYARVSPSSGTSILSLAPEAGTVQGLAIGEGNTLFMSNTSSSVVALDAGDGSLKWVAAGDSIGVEAEMTHTRQLLALALGLLVTASPVATQTVPTTTRDPRQPATVFTRPALIVAGFVMDKCLSEERDMDGRSSRPPLIHRLVSAGLYATLRVNERLPDQPDLSSTSFLLKMDGTDIELAFGKSYILLINVAPGAHPGYPHVPNAPAEYVPAVPDLGFEDDGRNVHVLKPGGALSAYDGTSSEELRRAIERGR